MKTGLSLKQLIENVTDLSQKLTGGAISSSELDELVETTAALHEKAAIIRFKAFENQVFGSTHPLESTTLEESVTTEAAVEYNEPAVDLEKIETHIPEPVVVDHSNENQGASNGDAVESMPEEIESEETGFDLFSLDVSEPIDEKPVVDSPIVEVKNDEGQSSAVNLEAVATEIKTPSPEESAPASPEVQKPAAPSGNLHALYSKIDKPDDSFASRFPVNRIDNLNTAFGFNERLQTINELFGGSSEVFTAAINELQTASSKEQARAIVSRYAEQNFWNPADDVAVNFAKKVDQLYA